MIASSLLMRIRADPFCRLIFGFALQKLEPRRLRSPHFTPVLPKVNGELIIALALHVSRVPFL